MRKRQEADSPAAFLAGLARRFTLTWEERAMVAAILLSMLVGALVMHYRREYRLEHPAMVSPTPKAAEE